MFNFSPKLVLRQFEQSDKNTLVTRAPSKRLERFVGKKLTLVTNEDFLGIKVNGKPAGNIRIYNAAFCAAVIRHYDDQGSNVASSSVDQFLEKCSDKTLSATVF